MPTPSVSRKTFGLLPPAPGKCQICAEESHGAELPHNPDSLFYQVSFRSRHGRSPTWADASSECSELVIRTWRKVLCREKVKPSKMGRMLSHAEAAAAIAAIALIDAHGPQSLRAISNQIEAHTSTAAFAMAQEVLAALVYFGELESNGQTWSIR